MKTTPIMAALETSLTTHLGLAIVKDWSRPNQNMTIEAVVTRPVIVLNLCDGSY